MTVNKECKCCKFVETIYCSAADVLLEFIVIDKVWLISFQRAPFGDQRPPMSVNISFWICITWIADFFGARNIFQQSKTCRHWNFISVLQLHSWLAGVWSCLLYIFVYIVIIEPEAREQGRQCTFNNQKHPEHLEWRVSHCFTCLARKLVRLISFTSDLSHFFISLVCSYSWKYPVTANLNAMLLHHHNLFQILICIWIFCTPLNLISRPTSSFSIHYILPGKVGLI